MEAPKEHILTDLQRTILQGLIDSGASHKAILSYLTTFVGNGENQNPSSPDEKKTTIDLNQIQDNELKDANKTTEQ